MADKDPKQAETDDIKQSREYMAFMEKAKMVKAVNFKTHFPGAAAKVTQMAKDGKAKLSPEFEKAKAKPELLKSIVTK